MNIIRLKTGQIAYDPRGRVAAEPKALTSRVPSLEGLRLGVLDNTKWNGGKLLRKVISLLGQENPFKDINYYKKESFSKNAAPHLIEQVAAENDAALTAIGD